MFGLKRLINWFKSFSRWFQVVSELRKEEELDLREDVPQDGAEVVDGDESVEVVKESELRFRKKAFLWCLDAGHGIDTKGKRSPL